MVTIEQINKLRELVDVSYEDAKIALEATSGDILDAVIYLEHLGKVSQTAGSYRTQSAGGPWDSPEMGAGYGTRDDWEQDRQQWQAERATHAQQKRQSGGEKIKRAFSWTIRNALEVYKNNSLLVRLPILVILPLLLFATWTVVALLLLALLTGCRFFLKGPNMRPEVNETLGKVSDAADQFRDDIRKP